MKVDDYLFKNRVPLMSKAMDAYSLRASTSAKNIANVNTVDYSPQKVEFEELFSSGMALAGSKTNNNHINIGANPNPSAEVTERAIPPGEEYASGENDINIDEEMAEIAETQIRFQFASQSMSKYFRQIGAAITGNSNF